MSRVYEVRRGHVTAGVGFGFSASSQGPCPEEGGVGGPKGGVALVVVVTDPV